MVNAVHFVADASDEQALLDHLDRPEPVDLWPWPYVDRSEPPVPHADLARHAQLLVHLPTLGPLVMVAGPGSVYDPDPLASVGILARFRSAPVPLPPTESRGLVDTNVTPVLLWQRRRIGALLLSEIGSQADAMDLVGPDYARWVRRVQSWVRRRGIPIWGLAQHTVRPDLDIELSYVNTVVALPGALRRLESGLTLRDR